MNLFSNIIFDPPFPQPVIYGLGAALVLVAMVAYWRRTVGVGKFGATMLLLFRVLVIFGLTFVLLRPMKMKPSEVASRKPVFSVLVDVSQSMNTEDMPLGDNRKCSRLKACVNEVQKQREEFYEAMRRWYDLRFFEFDSSMRPSGISMINMLDRAEGESTDISQALMAATNAAGSRKQSGMLLLSDGRSNADAGSNLTDVSRYLRSMKIPVWTIPVGTASQARDVFVTANLSQSFMFVNQPAKLKIAISGSGYDNHYARMNVLREDEVIKSEQVLIRPGLTTEEIPVEEAESGTVKYSVEIEPLPGESDKTNNRRSVFARVVNKKTQVLVVEARPYWDSKFLLRALRKDPNLNITSIFYINEDKQFAIAEQSTGIGDEKQVKNKVRLPRTKEELFKYDCILLGREMDQVFSTDELKLLREYLVERGGSVIFARGKSYAQANPNIEKIEPVIWEDEILKNARFELTTQGRDSPLFSFDKSKSSDLVLRELPSMISVTRVKQSKSLSVILAKSRADDKMKEVAAITYQRYGKGKVMSIGTTGLWKWAFMPENLEEYDDVYQKFWSQMIRWLIADTDFLPGQSISFHSDRNNYQAGDSVRLSIHTKMIEPEKYDPQIEIHEPSGQKIKLKPEMNPDQPGIYRLSYKPPMQGEYIATLKNNIGEPKEDTVRFTVYTDSIELRQVSANHDLMDQISEVTGGELLALEDLGSLQEKVREFEKLSQEKVQPVDIWDRAKIFWTFIILLALEWFIRRRVGLA